MIQVGGATRRMVSPMIIPEHYKVNRSILFRFSAAARI